MPQNITSTAPRTREAWRFRRCPGCLEVFPAGKLRQLDYGANWQERGDSRCQCPYCGLRGQRSVFTVVRDERLAAQRQQMTQTAERDGRAAYHREGATLAHTIPAPGGER